MIFHNAQVGFAVLHPHPAVAACHDRYRPVFQLQVRRAWLNSINRILVTERQVLAEMALFLNGEISSRFSRGPVSEHQKCAKADTKAAQRKPEPAAAIGGNAGRRL